MEAIDKYRYRLPGGSDFPGLGENEALPRLDAPAIRRQLSFADSGCWKTERRAVLLLLERIAQYYTVIGYTGPLVTRFNAEIGTAYGRWFEERAYGQDHSRREVFHTTNNYAWSTPERIYRDTRFACIESALLLAQWEFLQEVPESDAVLKLARWTALRTVQSSELSGVRWHAKRGRWGTKGIRKHLAHTLELARSADYVPGALGGRFSLPQANQALTGTR